MRTTLVALALVGSVTVVSAAERLPTFPKGTPYGSARSSLIALGWKPVTMPEAQACDEDDDRCKGRPEMESCAGTGLANCNFTWRRGDTLVAIGTIGETNPVVVGARCRAGC
ncbi:hypothetical protein [Methylobacterium sp. WL116]|uniref:hypothetical protein n=1 Tax=Methylobacterium sp. WL116 TaxID=2603889 RepID=UPI0011C7EF26|nr:hypothetical protein [Methylobacterium sp. WL116]TXM94827.1 hypothetical protein FV223_03260 [Methylobacterium sp. WL116]